MNDLISMQSDKLGNVGYIATLFVLLVSTVSSYAVSVLYLKFYGSAATGSQIHRAFPLLGVSITSLFISIQFSLPLSLGLLGALSIVRFRTPIKEPEEIAFLMVVIAISIGCAIFDFAMVLMVLGISLTALVLVRKFGYPTGTKVNSGLMIIRFAPVPNSDLCSEILTFMDENTRGGIVESIVNDDGGRTVLTYRIDSRSLEIVDRIRRFVLGRDQGAVVDFYAGQA